MMKVIASQLGNCIHERESYSTLIRFGYLPLAVDPLAIKDMVWRTSKPVRQKDEQLSASAAFSPDALWLRIVRQESKLSHKDVPAQEGLFECCALVGPQLGKVIQKLVSTNTHVQWIVAQ